MAANIAADFPSILTCLPLIVIRYTLAGVLLSYCVLLTLAILSMAVFMIQGGHPVAAPQVGIFGALFALSLGILIWYMKGMKSPSTWALQVDLGGVVHKRGG